MIPAEPHRVLPGPREDHAFPSRSAHRLREVRAALRASHGSVQEAHGIRVEAALAEKEAQSFRPPFAVWKRQGTFLPGDRPVPPVARHVFSWKQPSVTGGEAHVLPRAGPRHRWQGTFLPGKASLPPPSPDARSVEVSARPSAGETPLSPTGRVTCVTAPGLTSDNPPSTSPQAAPSASSRAASSGACSRAQRPQIGARSSNTLIPGTGSRRALQRAQSAPGVRSANPAR